MADYYRKIILDGTSREIIEKLLLYQGNYLRLNLVGDIGVDSPGRTTLAIGVLKFYGKYKLIHEKPCIFRIEPDGLETENDDEGIVLICNEDGSETPTWGLLVKLFPTQQRSINIGSISEMADMNIDKDKVFHSDKTCRQPSVDIGIRVPANSFLLSVWVKD